MDIIQSSSNPFFKNLRKLAENRRERMKTGQALLDGIHLLSAWLDAGRPIRKVILTQAGFCNPEISTQLARADISYVLLQDGLFAELSDLPSPSGVLSLVDIPESRPPQTEGLCLLLDGVQDPGNVGSILRTAAAAGVDQVLLSSGCADVWSPKTLRAGMGAQAVLDIVERADLYAFAERFRGRLATTLLDGSTDLYTTDLNGSLALVFGAEGCGVSPQLAQKANVRIRIPMAPGIESLNVAVATAICLYERVRQQRQG